MMNGHSFWEEDSWLGGIDHAVIGSGIVGLSCALHLKKRFPSHRIVVFESGVLPSGASTKNAGFACFGSVSELLDDLRSHSEQEVIDLVNLRIKGLERLKANLGLSAIAYQELGSYEVFREDDNETFQHCMDGLAYINGLMRQTVLGKKEVFLVKNDPFSFKKCKKTVIFNPFEGQLHTGKMMQALIDQARSKGIFILNGVKITEIDQKTSINILKTSKFGQIRSKNVYVATNGFASQLLDEEVRPARAQVLITSPIKGLPIKGCFHLDRGYYYFRNVGERLLLGGGRNLDFEGETTTEMKCTPLIQDELERLLAETILPDTDFSIEMRWSGIMGVGSQKRPIVRKVSDGLYCGVRLGGMGVAIGSLVGEQLAELSGL
jgi:glycine/D-amino acid oxidase-like deaminating enzyme